MKVYIVRLEDELKIFKVQLQDEAAFLEKYQSCIIVTGSTIQDLIIQFARLKENE